MLRSRLFQIAIFCSGRDQQIGAQSSERPMARPLLRHGERRGGYLEGMKLRMLTGKEFL